MTVMEQLRCMLGRACRLAYFALPVDTALSAGGPYDAVVKNNGWVVTGIAQKLRCGDSQNDDHGGRPVVSSQFG